MVGGRGKLEESVRTEGREGVHEKTCTRPPILTTHVHTPSQLEEVELKPNGGDIDVTERNRKEYVE